MTEMVPERQIACAVVRRAGKLLLGRRSPRARTYAGCWDLIGGHVEPGESVEAALIREIQEEPGVTPTAFERLGEIAEPEPARNGPAIYVLYTITAWMGGEPAMRGDEHVDLRWFSIEDACALPGLALREYQPFLAGIDGGSKT